MRLRYTAAALVHLDAIYNFLVERNPVAARRIADDIYAAAERLRDFPYIGRKSAVADTHERVVRGSPYLIVYEVDEPNVEIRVLRSFTAHKIGRSL
jgi:plasmid stabilization system protein ParE